jgi:hypothetical protein
VVLYDSLLHLYREKLEQEEACFHKACCSYMRIQLAVFSYYLVLFILLLLEMLQKLSMQAMYLYNGLPKIWQSSNSSLFCANCQWELMKSVGKHACLSLLFMMKVIMRELVSQTLG